jgi:hypothetical protein
MFSKWTRTERLTLYSLLVAMVGVSITLLTVQEFRQFLGLDNSMRANPQVASASPVSVDTRELPTRQLPSEQTVKKRVNVPADKIWADTGITLTIGARLNISSSGRWSDGGQPFRYWGPNGTGDPWPGTILASANLDALIGKVSDTAFLVGSNYSGTSPASGRLYLSINDVPNSFSGNIGSMNVEIEYSQP